MARMKPDSFDYNATGSFGEGRIYDTLKNNLNDKWLVCHSWRWIRHYLNKRGRKKQGEGDFVLFHPDVGIIVIEVKGGAIEYRNDGKFYSNNKLIQNPEKQASDTKYDIVERLKEKKINTHCWVSHCVWFPDIEWNIPYPPNFNSTILLDKTALSDPEPRLIAVANSAQPIIDPKIINIIECLLFSPFRIVKNLLSRLEDSVEEQIRLTNQQSNIYDGLGRNPVLGIRGRAGTGKTLLAIHKAVEFSKTGKKVLYLCSSKGLSEYLKEKIGIQGVNVFTYQKYALNFLEKHFPLRIPIDFKGVLDFEYILAAFTEVADQNLDGYDVCFIDEAQDINVTLFDSLRSGFVGKGYFYFFYDPLQIAYSRSVKLEDPFIKNNDFIFSLTRNLRNTFEVSKASLNILNVKYKFERDFSAVTGETPEVILIHDNLISEVKKKLISLTLIERIPKSYISIISMKGEGKSEAGTEIEDVPVKTFRKFKGLDNNIILLIDVSYQHFVDEVFSRELYMAITRGKYFVFIFLDNSSSNLKNSFCTKFNTAIPNADLFSKIFKENHYE